MKTNIILKTVLGFVAMFLIVGGVVMFLWNWMMPELPVLLPYSLTTAY
jgi:hypothetical protein